MGIVISVFGVSVCVGPVMGGAFTDHLSWRWCFWMYDVSKPLLRNWLTGFYKVTSPSAYLCWYYSSYSYV
jgi:MFS family permease